MSPNSWSSCLHIPTSEIISTCHWFYVVLGIKQNSDLCMLGKYSTNWVMAPARVSLIFNIALSFCLVFLLKVKFPWLEIYSGPLRIINIENQDTRAVSPIHCWFETGRFSIWPLSPRDSSHFFPIRISISRKPQRTQTWLVQKHVAWEPRGDAPVWSLSPSASPWGTIGGSFPHDGEGLGLEDSHLSYTILLWSHIERATKGRKSPLLSWACLKVDCQELFPEFS